MDSIRRQLILSVPAAAVAGLTGCGGADSADGARASAQAVGSGNAQAQNATPSGDGITIRHRSNSNFPLIDGVFELQPTPGLIQGVVNMGTPGGRGPVLAIQISSSRQLNDETLIVSLNLSIKLNTTPGAASTYVLGPGGAQAGDCLLTCRRLMPDGSVATHAHRINDGALTILRPNDNTIQLSVRDLIAIPAPGFNNMAQGSVTLSSNNYVTLMGRQEDTGSALT